MSDSSGTPPTGRVRSDPSVRRLGTVLLPLLFAEGVLGVASAGGGFGAPTVLLVVHVALGTVLVGVATWVLVVVRSQPDPRARWTGTLTVLGVYATAGTGAFFLATGFAAAGPIDRGLALLDLLGAVLMILWGRPPRAEGRTLPLTDSPARPI
ncbi:MAG TPA: hypothetical protein VGV89_03095 [Thermoplasmata archaeon]|nr:hypothetical protein [Thermoplasmata archaeon]